MGNGADYIFSCPERFGLLFSLYGTNIIVSKVMPYTLSFSFPFCFYYSKANGYTVSACQNLTPFLKGS